ncbi:alpha/beta fold hydrolase [Ahrensia marina]|uniref:Alpha/beta hydrolase n=1 Tax=Ahrensia marina TaxID=1514904 RepID=A0A0M9GLD8_9HYPH|nr:alpha/beta hydrolase [Ahrensia marina]KPB00146.1 alpha/beta hydrolase [Ahrensia marina]
MPDFYHDDLNFAFHDEGSRDATPILLIHGFASNKRVNWVSPGWVQTLTDAGYRVIAIDNRGHGESDKPHEPEAYTPETMADDAAALLDHLDIRQAHVMGYSMGARISAFLALRHPDKVKSLIFGGLGIGMVEGVGEWDPIADALLAPSLDDVTHEQGRTFRKFADQTKSDRFALAACIKSSRTLISKEDMAKITVPTLVAVGTKDDIAGSPAALAELMENAQAFEIERRDHMLAVGDASFKKTALSFLNDQL